MPLPPDALIFKESMDPSDLDVFAVDLRGTPEQPGFLREGENAADFALEVTPEAVALGLTIETAGGRAPAIVGDILNFWISFDPATRADPAFSVAGMSLGIECTITTSSVPSRRRQRTLVVKVAQK